jgi:Cellulase (glycosyl hydrolase family 5)
MRRIAPSILALCALVAAALPAAAQASHSQSMTFEAPVDLANPATRTTAFDEISSFGVKSIRIVMLWQNVAPAPSSRVKPDFDATNPASYNWSAYDAQIDGAAARGWTVLLTVSGPVPQWASNGARDNLTRPSPSEFQSFVTAAARHYGTKVARWAIWNEPNQPQFLLPQYSAGKHTPLSPRIYRNLFLAGQRGLRAGGLPNAQVLIGETSPRGTTHVVAPLTFLRGVFCVDSRYRKVGNCAQLHADGYAHHAYTTAQGPLFKPKQPNDVTIGVIGRLITALNRVRSAGAVDRRLNINLTEFGIQSTPDPIVGVSQARQSDYRSIAERLAYDQPRIVAFSQYLLRDDPPKDGVPLALRYPGFESGLRTNAGRAKPALTGFRLPLAALRRGSRVSLWGLVRPATASTTATVEYTSGGSFKKLFTVRTDSRGYFTRNTTFRSGRRYRLVWTQPSGQSIHGTTTSVYRR